MMVAHFEGEGWDLMLSTIQRWRREGATLVTTAGAFDGLEGQHVALLQEARAQGDRLIVALPSDASLRARNGEGHPVYPEQERSLALSGLRAVDAVVVFPDLLPLRFLKAVMPDVHCRGEEDRGAEVPEAPLVIGSGGRIHSLSPRRGAPLIGRGVVMTDPGMEILLLDLLGAANSLRQVAFAHAATLSALAERLADDIMAHRRVFVAAEARKMAALGPLVRPLVEVLKDGRAGDLAVFGGGGDARIATLRARGMTVVILAGPEPVGEGADICLRVPAAVWMDVGHQAILLALVRRTLCVLAERSHPLYPEAGSS